MRNDGKIKQMILSIKPEYFDLIASGKKRIEIRKIAPLGGPKFWAWLYVSGTGEIKGAILIESVSRNYIDRHHYITQWHDRIIKESCLHPSVLYYYAKGLVGSKRLFFCWHITNFRRLDEMEASGFNVPELGRPPQSYKWVR